MIVNTECLYYYIYFLTYEFWLVRGIFVNSCYVSVGNIQERLRLIACQVGTYTTGISRHSTNINNGTMI